MLQYDLPMPFCEIICIYVIIFLCSAETCWFLFKPADLPPENETSGYIFIHAEGGLNQQRIAVSVHSV